MVAPSLAKQTERQNLLTNINTVRKNAITARTWANWDDFIAEVKAIGSATTAPHWDVTYNATGEGWDTYLMENIDEADEGTANNEVDHKIGAVLYVLAEALIKYYHRLTMATADLGIKREIFDDLTNYQTAYNTTNETAVYNDADIADLLTEVETEGTRTGPLPPDPWINFFAHPDGALTAPAINAGHQNLWRNSGLTPAEALTAYANGWTDLTNNEPNTNVGRIYNIGVLAKRFFYVSLGQNFVMVSPVTNTKNQIDAMNTLRLRIANATVVAELEEPATTADSIQADIANLIDGELPINHQSANIETLRTQRITVLNTPAVLNWTEINAKRAEIKIELDWWDNKLASVFRDTNGVVITKSSTAFTCVPTSGNLVFLFSDRTKLDTAPIHWGQCLSMNLTYRDNMVNVKNVRNNNVTAVELNRLTPTWNNTSNSVWLVAKQYLQDDVTIIFWQSNLLKKYQAWHESLNTSRLEREKLEFIQSFTDDTRVKIIEYIDNNPDDVTKEVQIEFRVVPNVATVLPPLFGFTTMVEYTAKVNQLQTLIGELDVLRP